MAEITYLKTEYLIVKIQHTITDDVLTINRYGQIVVFIRSNYTADIGAVFRRVT